jgi:hypothetical protein
MLHASPISFSLALSLYLYMAENTNYGVPH